MMEIEGEVMAYPGKKVRLDLLLGTQSGRISWLVSLLAILELVRLKRFGIEQAETFGKIYLVKEKGAD